MRHGSKVGHVFPHAVARSHAAQGTGHFGADRGHCGRSSSNGHAESVCRCAGKMRREFRNFGANIVVEAKTGQSFSAEELQGIRRCSRKSRTWLFPSLTLSLATKKTRPVVAVGTDLDLARKLNPWWAVSNWPHAQGEALVGVRAQHVLGSALHHSHLSFQGRAIHLASAGTLRTGAGEDSRVYVSLPEFQAVDRAIALSGRDRRHGIEQTM